MSLWTPIIKTADETKTGATVTDDNTLVLTLNASKTYRLRFQILCSSPATPDFRWAFKAAAITAGSLGFYGSVTQLAPGSNYVEAHEAYDLASIVAGTAVAMNGTATATHRGIISGSGLIKTPSSSPGTFAFQWSQQINNASPSTVHAGSFLLYEEFT